MSASPHEFPSSFESLPTEVELKAFEFERVWPAITYMAELDFRRDANPGDTFTKRKSFGGEEQLEFELEVAYHDAESFTGIIEDGEPFLNASLRFSRRRDDLLPDLKRQILLERQAGKLESENESTDQLVIPMGTNLAIPHEEETDRTVELEDESDHWQVWESRIYQFNGDYDFCFEGHYRIELRDGYDDVIWTNDTAACVESTDPDEAEEQQEVVEDLYNQLHTSITSDDIELIKTSLLRLGAHPALLL